MDGWASRVGIQEYRNVDGTIRRELREDNAVFDMDSLLGFEGAPITDDHPSVMVDINNAKHLTKGTVLSVGRRDGEHVAVSLVITDPGLIKKMESGKRQLSTGYYVELDETPGVHPKFGRYDAKQVRVGPVNHLAVVDRGRAGTASVRMDSAAADASSLIDVRFDDLVEVVPDDVVARLDALAKRLDAFNADVPADVEARLDALAKKLDDYNPDQPRDESGRFGEGGGGGGGSKESSGGGGGGDSKKESGGEPKAEEPPKTASTFEHTEGSKAFKETPEEAAYIHKATEVAHGLVKDWQDKLGDKGIQIKMGGSLTSGLALPGDVQDADIRFLFDGDRKSMIPEIEKVTGLKLRKEIKVGGGADPISDAYMIEGVIEKDGVKLEVEGALRTAAGYTGWQNQYKDVLTKDELQTARARKWELTQGDTGRKAKDYKAYKNSVLAEVQSRVLAARDKKTKTDSAQDLQAVLTAANLMPHSVGMNLDAALTRIKELEEKLDALFEKAPAAAEKTCGSCEAMNAADATECTKCGATLASDKPAAEKPAFLKDAADAELARLEGERDVARQDALDAKTALDQVRKDADESVGKKVREALDVLSSAIAILGKDTKIKLDGKNVELLDAPLRDVKCAVVKHLKGKTINAEKLDAYVDALFEDAVETFSPGTKSLLAAKTVVEDNGRKDAIEAPLVSVTPEAKAAADLKTSISSAWMTAKTES